MTQLNKRVALLVQEKHMLENNIRDAESALRTSARYEVLINRPSLLESLWVGPVHQKWLHPARDLTARCRFCHSWNSLSRTEFIIDSALNPTCITWLIQRHCSGPTFQCRGCQISSTMPVTCSLDVSAAVLICSPVQCFRLCCIFYSTIPYHLSVAVSVSHSKSGW